MSQALDGTVDPSTTEVPATNNDMASEAAAPGGSTLSVHTGIPDDPTNQAEKAETAGESLPTEQPPGDTDRQTTVIIPSTFLDLKVKRHKDCKHKHKHRDRDKDHRSSKDRRARNKSKDGNAVKSSTKHSEEQILGSRESESELPSSVGDVEVRIDQEVELTGEDNPAVTAALSALGNGVSQHLV